MLGRPAERFIRTEWASVQELAEEIYATFSPLLEIEASKITINQEAGDTSPPFVINRPSDATGPGFVINKGGGTNNFGDIDIHGSDFGDTTFSVTPDYGLPPDGTTITFGDEDEGGSSGGGGVDLASIYFPNQQLGSVPFPQDNPVMLYGEIVSKTSGQTYEVNVWAKSPLGPKIGRIPVRFTMVDPDEEIPAGTPTPVLIFPATVGAGRVVGDAIGFVPAFMEEGT